MMPAATPAQSTATQRETFSRAWRAAAQGDRAVFEQLKPGLRDYLLYPYLQYEDFRHRRTRIDAMTMKDFLQRHRDWAFTPALEMAWLRSLGARARWDELLLHAPGSEDTHVRCYLARARIERGQTAGLLEEARSLWTVGQSQPDACDAVFNWLRKQGGIDSSLAWERIRRAMDARQPRLTLYLKRYLDESDRIWADRWYQQDRGGYRRLNQAADWPDAEQARDITDYGLRRLARSDSDRAWRFFQTLESHVGWTADSRAAISREIALWSAVEGADETALRMGRVPQSYRDGRLLEWQLRYELARENWENVIAAYAAMASEQKDDARWRYWEARAREHSGDVDEARKSLQKLAGEANYYGFLAADRLNLPYAICPEDPVTEPAEVKALRHERGFQRALELRQAGIANWSRSEWQLAANRLDRKGLRIAAALAVEENWPDMAIIALGNSGDLRWYEWRFPLMYEPLVGSAARERNLDPSWVLGLMRSESAMAEDALSPAGARGLMQVMPQTARKLAQRHNIRYAGQQQLMQAEDNIVFGTTYLRELLDRFAGNPVLVSGAYNAGPNTVDRWLDDRLTDDPAIWVESLPYFETRDYIPRVLAFSTIYDWRLQRPVTRISSRMPGFDSDPGSGTMQGNETAEIACPTPG